MKLENIFEHDNLAEVIDKERLKEIGASVLEGFETDQASRAGWTQRNAEAMKLALQIVDSKSFPWQGASNVKYPLITVACMQYNARAYPALVPGRNIVKCVTVGEDLDGEKARRGTRVSEHMNYQLCDEMTEWEEDHDRLLIIQPLIGTVFKKTYFDPEKGRNCSELVHPENLVIDYYAKSVESARRKTHILIFEENELIERFRSGYYIETELTGGDYIPQVSKTTADSARGLSPSSEYPYTVLEQHGFLDLDEDGYKEPYVIHALKTGEVLGIYKRFYESGVYFTRNKVSKIVPVEYFTKYGFLPSPDGSIYDIGFGSLLGPSSRAVDSLINQLIDTGTLQNAGGGWLARSIRIKGGKISISPGKWHHTDASAGDLKDGIVQFPAPAPSSVLYNLAQMLISAGQRIGSTSEIMMGESPGQNQPATTSMAVLEQSLQVFSAIYKRTYRSMKSELKKLYELNRRYLDPVSYFNVVEGGAEVFQKDYQGPVEDLVPVADPNIVSPSQRLMKAEALAQRVMAMPDLYGTQGRLEAEKRYLEALQVQGIDRLLPKDAKEIPPPVDQRLELDKARIQDESEREWTKVEINARTEMSRMEKDKANIARTMATIEDQKERTDLEVARVMIETEQSRVELIANAIKHKADLRRQEGVGQGTGN